MKYQICSLALILAGFGTLTMSLTAHGDTPDPIFAQAEQIKLPLPEIETLPNGLQVIWFLSDQLPVIDLALVVKSGYRDDPTGKTGTSELLSAVMDRGAAGLSAQQIAQQVEQLGASRYISDEEEPAQR